MTAFSWTVGISLFVLFIFLLYCCVRVSAVSNKVESSPYLCVNSLRYILHLIRLLMIVAAVELSEPVYHAMLPTL